MIAKMFLVLLFLKKNMIRNIKLMLPFKVLPFVLIRRQWHIQILFDSSNPMFPVYFFNSSNTGKIMKFSRGDISPGELKRKAVGQAD